ncbi:hypothetical protein BV25DRAFT_1827707 [Artomyces pyxidatus]|uniref:Uncharacterized protein n=1 Tax=Artomyces pyxidatus TaxID=48021 RepID=A0ACB8SVB3_9AGAM|nr:hypothetical protein BV25DRAFT_1827707 [Artomyces pyxidatus]
MKPHAGCLLPFQDFVLNDMTLCSRCREATKTRLRLLSNRSENIEHITRRAKLNHRTCALACGYGLLVIICKTA